MVLVRVMIDEYSTYTFFYFLYPSAKVRKTNGSAIKVSEDRVPSLSKYVMVLPAE